APTRTACTSSASTTPQASQQVAASSVQLPKPLQRCHEGVLDAASAPPSASVEGVASKQAASERVRSAKKSERDGKRTSEADDPAILHELFVRENVRIRGVRHALPEQIEQLVHRDLRDR